MYKIRSWLYVGNFAESENATLLATHNIKAVLQVAHSVNVPGVACLYLPVSDDVPLQKSQLRRGVDFILAQKEQGNATMVACHAGMSRSPTFAIAALKEVEDLQLLDALRALREHHPHAMPNTPLWRSLCNYYGKQRLLGR